MRAATVPAHERQLAAFAIEAQAVAAQAQRFNRLCSGSHQQLDVRLWAAHASAHKRTSGGASEQIIAARRVVTEAQARAIADPRADARQRLPPTHALLAARPRNRIGVRLKREQAHHAGCKPARHGACPTSALGLAAAGAPGKRIRLSSGTLVARRSSMNSET